LANNLNLDELFDCNNPPKDIFALFLNQDELLIRKFICGRDSEKLP
ncbi:9279_t:CDS:1, partial [Gigaspora margarita]